MNAIETNTLSKLFGSRTAVNSLDLSVGDGEFFSLLGQNGAGKTTTIKMLSCLIAPSSGDAFLYGHSIINDRAAVKQIINVSPQETAVAPKLSVRENLEFIAEIYGHGSNAKKKAEKMLEDFNLSDRASDKAKNLSGGMQRRLSIAMALISDPKILFLDEPTLGLDVLARRELWNHIKALKGKITVILTTHYLEEAEALSDRIGVINDGNMKALGTADELIKLAGAKNFEDAFITLATKGGER